MTPLTKPFLDDPETRKWIVDRIPLGRHRHVERWRTPSSSLASPAASLVTAPRSSSTAAGPRGDADAPARSGSSTWRLDRAAARGTGAEKAMPTIGYMSGGSATFYAAGSSRRSARVYAKPAISRVGT